MKASIGYAYPTSYIAEHFNFGQEGCAYLKPEGSPIKYAVSASHGSAKALKHVITYANENGYSIDESGLQWARNIIRRHK